jgi:hypothetical protein
VKASDGADSGMWNFNRFCDFCGVRLDIRRRDGSNPKDYVKFSPPKSSANRRDGRTMVG